MREVADDQFVEGALRYVNGISRALFEESEMGWMEMPPHAGPGERGGAPGAHALPMEDSKSHEFGEQGREIQIQITSGAEQGKG